MDNFCISISQKRVSNQKFTQQISIGRNSTYFFIKTKKGFFKIHSLLASLRPS